MAAEENTDLEWGIKNANSKIAALKLRPYHINQLWDYMLGRETFGMEMARRYNAKFALKTLKTFDRLFNEPELDVELVPSLDDLCSKCPFVEDRCRFFDQSEERNLIDHLKLKVGGVYKARDITRIIENMQDIIAEATEYFRREE
ncbi:MAG: DUF1284 domain-containing protein [Nanoarchaeota archaeon]|nr:DUF1284 domain-containing protein [Nanoarchaeota archaeon]